MLPAWQADSDSQQTVPGICRDAGYFDQILVDKEGHALLNMEKLGTWGMSEDRAITLSFGKPQPLTVQSVYGRLGVSEA